MPIRQTGNWNPESQESKILLDAWDVHPMASMAISGGNDSAVGAFRRFFRIGSSGANISASEDTLFRFPGGSKANAFNVANQRIGAGNQRSFLEGFVSVPALQHPAGFDPSVLSNLSSVGPWRRATLSTTIRKAGAGANDDTLFGLQAEGGFGPWATGASTSVPMIYLHSPAGSTNYDRISLRVNTQFFTAPTFVPIAFQRADIFRRVKMIVDYGPIFRVRFLIDGVLVSDLSGADFAWDFPVGQPSDLTLLGYIRPAKDNIANSGIEGPYNTHLRIEVVGDV